MKKIYVILIIFIVLVFSLYYFARIVHAPQDVSNGKLSGNGQLSQMQGRCGLLVKDPQANREVTFPLRVTGTIDNSNAQSKGCSWHMFEG